MLLVGKSGFDFYSGYWASADDGSPGTLSAIVTVQVTPPPVATKEPVPEPSEAQVFVVKLESASSPS